MVVAIAGILVALAAINLFPSDREVAVRETGIVALSIEHARDAAWFGGRPTAVTFTDGRIYTVAPLGKVLRLDDISVRVARVVWRQSITTAFKPPGTKIYGLVTLTIANLSKAAQEVGPTQIWLRDAAGNPHLAAAGAQIPQNLLKIRIAPGKSVSGTLVFPAPRRETGYLLVYRFADASAIAKAKHVGLLRYG